MSSKLVLLIGIFLVAVKMAKGLSISPQKKSLRSNPYSPHSCLDHYKKGLKSNGFYKIYIKGNGLTVYCDMNSEPGVAWTLVESFAFQNKAIMPEFQLRPLWTNAPVNENSPNRNKYRMTKANMDFIKSQSTHWRATCNFPTNQIDYIDYVRATFASFDVMTFNGAGDCKLVEYVNIRGHECAHCTSQWWQGSNYGPHINSPSVGCHFKPNKGAVSSEDNFGLYGGTNNKFRCSSSPKSTTNWWFGGYV